MAAADAELRVEDVRQLWSLACLLAQRQLMAQTAQCLEPLCALDCSDRSAEEQEILVQANALLAEICSVACSNSRKADDRDLWTRRVIQVEKCIYSVDAAVERGVACSDENKLRLLKAKFLLQQQLKAERTAKNRRMLEILCEGLKRCAEAEVEKTDVELVAEFRQYFAVKLKACLLKMHAATVMAKHAKDSDGINSFADNLKYLRSTLPNYIDKSFLLWLVEVTCHAVISSFQPGSTAEMRQLVDFGQEFFDKVSLEQPVSPDFRMHHLIITGFYYLRTGKMNKVASLLETIVALSKDTGSDGDQPTSVMKEPYLNTIMDSMRANLQTYAQHPAKRLILTATLFDMLHIYCHLQALQCRYAEMGASIVQMTTLFGTYKPYLERTIFYRFFLARCHTLIAKYATAIGKVKDACAHLNFVVDKLLPTPVVEEASYPDAYLAVWVEVLEVAMYCCGVATNSAASDAPTNLQIKQIYPDRKLLEWVTRVLTMDSLKHHIYQCCSVELRAKYDLGLAKWMWATDGLSRRAVEEGKEPPRFTRYASLEALRPRAFTLLHETMQRLNASMNSGETMSEIMALFGSQLVAFGKAEQGEEMLTNASRTTLHSKNVLLQTRLLADVFELYASKGLVEAQAAAANKYNKKVKVLQHRVAAAQAEEATASVLLRWTAGSGSTQASTPSRG
ncbi:Growth hormone-regulated TBC protein 1 [Phytophthora cinnamomi]|uniref:Growth hormone-regulated TBC protein 1 n=1 Tax=Phytophthora cinnamomi TaxID=4785 RepID=UPI003559747A|nr:Growth hormone-regulated TBC protein 1 [Phytophthora cinnamomi]